MTTNPQHEPLETLLKQWQAPNPAGDFEQNVLRRIRLQQPSPTRSWWETVTAGLTASAVALIVSFILTQGMQPRSSGIVRAESVTGGYAQLLTGSL